jgi:hypothetical protein
LDINKDLQHALKLTRRRVQSTLHQLQQNFPEGVEVLQIIVHDRK